MARKAEKHGLRFRPHFKTHQSADIGEWIREFGVTAITVSSVSMARYFADHGWKDITIAFPLNILEIDEINSIASRIGINLLIENEFSLTMLLKKLNAQTGLYIEIDTGYHRTGIDALKPDRIERLLRMLKNNRLITFKGFLSHSGQTYSATSKEEIIRIHAEVMLKMRTLKQYFHSEWPDLEISLGDTPACSVCEEWTDVDEIRPGNFIFYDLMQFRIGSCTEENIAVKVVCPVVSRSITRQEVVIYGGAVHFSKEFVTAPGVNKWYGAIVDRNVDNRWRKINNSLYVSGLSQEHGIIKGEFDEIRKIQPGDCLEVIPVHSCLAADLAGSYVTNEGKILGKMSK